MSFTFEIQEVYPIRGKGLIILLGKLLDGKMHQGDIIGVPTQDGVIIPAVLTDMEADHKKVNEVEAGQAELVGFLIRSGIGMNVTLGQSTDWSKEKYSAWMEAERQKHRVPQDTPPPKDKSPWWAFWRK
jgi:hypothetical protein